MPPLQYTPYKGLIAVLALILFFDMPLIRGLSQYQLPNGTPCSTVLIYTYLD